jgi:hypothetical protein
MARARARGGGVDRQRADPRDGGVRDPAARKAGGGLVRIGSQRRGCKHRERREHCGGNRIGACLDSVDDDAPRRLRDLGDRDRQQ